MNFISAVLIIAATSNSSQPTDYKTAYQRAMNDDQPMLVLVTAEWCPPCRMMKSTTIPKMVADNKFKEVHFATIDLDKKAKTARKLIGNRGVPQLILYEKKNGAWSVKHLAGFQSAAKVESFIGSPSLRTAQANSSLAIGQ